MNKHSYFITIFENFSQTKQTKINWINWLNVNATNARAPIAHQKNRPATNNLETHQKFISAHY